MDNIRPVEAASVAAAASLQPAAPSHDLHHHHDRPRLWPFFLLYPALTRTTYDTLMWLRQRQLDLLLLLFFITFIIVMIGHDSGLSSSCVRS